MAIGSGMKATRWLLLVALIAVGMILDLGNIRRVTLYVPVVSMQVVEVDLDLGKEQDVSGTRRVIVQDLKQQQSEDVEEEEEDLASVDQEFLQHVEDTATVSSEEEEEEEKVLIEIPEAPQGYKFYVYDQFKDNELSPYKLSAKVRKDRRNPGNCEWGLKTCQDDGTGFFQYQKRRNNAAGDVVLADLFLRHPLGSMPHTPFASRTLDPKEADIFIVPYAHDTHCKAVEFDVRCEHAEIDAMVPKILKGLDYFQQSKALKARHLFLTSTCWPFSNQKFAKSVPMRTTIGDLRRKPCTVTEIDDNDDSSKWLCPDFNIPYLNQHPEYQPQIIHQRSEDWWTTRQRNVAVAAHFGKLGGKRNFRDLFMNATTTIFPNLTLAGLPVDTGSLGGQKRNIPKETATLHLYQDSIFCLILPGDGPAQKRFFDVIMSGCIPVVFVFDRYGENDGILSPQSKGKDPSWFDGWGSPKAANLRTTYPFAKGIYPDQPDLGIDYQQFVVQIRPNLNKGCDFGCGHNTTKDCTWDCVAPQLEALMQDEQELVRLRKNVRTAAGFFSFGLQDNAFQHYDAFSIILNHVGHTLQRMPPLQPEDRPVAVTAPTPNAPVKVLLQDDEDDSDDDNYEEGESFPKVNSAKFQTWLQNNLQQQKQRAMTAKPIEPPAPPTSFKFYVYDQFLEGKLSPYKLSTQVKAKVKRTLKSIPTGNCEWGLSPCMDNGKASSIYGGRRNNAAADVVLADLFLRYPVGSTDVTPFASRTLDPTEADLFVVPYAHDTHCKTVNFDVRCEDPKMKRLVPEILSSLEYFNQTYSKPLKQRHLFLSSTCYPFSNRGFIKSVPMRTTIGGMRKPQCSVTEKPAPNSNSSKWLCPDFNIPYLNQHPDYQPTVIEARSEEWWTTRQRNHSVAALFGRLGGKAVSFRDFFMNAADKIFPGSAVAGLPAKIGSMGKKRNIAKETATFELYKDTIFCLILPGDGPAQKRFFDVIMSGCIPVVFVFDRYGDNNGILSPQSEGKDPSWWDGRDNSVPKWSNIRTHYPFAKGIYPDQPDIGIDYQDLVVQIRPDPNNGCDFACGHTQKDCRFDCLVPQLEAMINETPQTEILRLRKNLMRAATWFSYGLKDDAFQSYDAFGMLLTQVGHTLQRMAPLQPNERAIRSSTYQSSLS